MQSVNTSITSVLPILSLLIVRAYRLQGATLKDCALAVFIGLISGACAMIFVATPIMAMLKEREPRYTAIRQKLAGRAATVAAPAYAGGSTGARGVSAGRAASAGATIGRVLDTPDGEGEAAEDGRPAKVAPRAVPTRRPGATAAPRPRQKRRKR